MRFKLFHVQKTSFAAVGGVIRTQIFNEVLIGKRVFKSILDLNEKNLNYRHKEKFP
jgi:hypothetical protein